MNFAKRHFGRLAKLSAEFILRVFEYIQPLIPSGVRGCFFHPSSLVCRCSGIQRSSFTPFSDSLDLSSRPVQFRPAPLAGGVGRCSVPKKIFGRTLSAFYIYCQKKCLMGWTKAPHTSAHKELWVWEATFWREPSLRRTTWASVADK